METDKRNGNAAAMAEHHILDHCIFIKEDATLVRVRYDEILYLYSSHVYVQVVTQFKTYIVRSSLTDYLTKLNSPVFMRIHRSHAVNLEHVQKITSSSVWVGAVELALSSQYRDELLSRIRH